MKKIVFIILSLVVVTSVLLISCSGEKDPVDNETVIKFNDLPLDAQNFISKYFGEETISRIDKNEYASTTIYSVYFEQYQIDFNEEGEWQQVDGDYGVSIPFAILPEPIQDTLNQRYPGFGVNQITRQGEYFVVVLTNNQGGDSIRLTFDQSGEIINQTLPN